MLDATAIGEVAIGETSSSGGGGGGGGGLTTLTDFLLGGVPLGVNALGEFTETSSGANLVVDTITVSIDAQDVTLYFNNPIGAFYTLTADVLSITINAQATLLYFIRSIAADTAAINISMQNVSFFLSGGGSIIDGVLGDSFQLSSASATAFGMKLQESLAVSGAMSGQRVWSIVEHLLLTGTVATNSLTGWRLNEILTIASQIQFGRPLTLHETLNITPVLTALQAVNLAERLLIAPALVPETHFSLTIAEALSLSVPMFEFFKGFDLSDSFTLTGTTAAQLKAGAIVTEHLNLSLTDTHQLLISALLDDEIELADVDVLNLILRGDLSETLELRAAYVSPGGTLATWVMNTRNSAVTEYSNYGFNSFAKLGNKYIGASRAGLYELDGPSDDGADLTWQLKSGFTQFNGSRRNGFKAIYLAMRGEGEYVLKLDTADGKHYGYKIRAHDGATTKIPVGKGLQARYWSFELIGIGARSELDGLEFVPLRMNRRV